MNIEHNEDKIVDVIENSKLTDKYFGQCPQLQIIKFKYVYIGENLVEKTDYKVYTRIQCGFM